MSDMSNEQNKVLGMSSLRLFSYPSTLYCSIEVSALLDLLLLKSALPVNLSRNSLDFYCILRSEQLKKFIGHLVIHKGTIACLRFPAIHKSSGYR